MTIQERLNTIAAALETASKQVRMLAAEMPAPETAQERINAINQRMLRSSVKATDDSASKAQG